VIQALVDGQPDLDNLSAVKRMVEEQLPQHLVRRWQQAVQAHLQMHPFREEEWSKLVEKEGPKARQLVESHAFLAYGATVLAVLVTESFVLYLQLGDGDILCVDAEGNTERPFPRDERLIGNESFSLCTHDAWTEVRTYVVPIAERPPSLILLSTDGYANCFRSEDDFLKVGTDYLQMVREEGLQQVESRLVAWLTEASQFASGDDITLGILQRVEETQVTPINPEAPRRGTGQQQQVSGYEPPTRREANGDVTHALSGASANLTHRHEPSGRLFAMWPWSVMRALLFMSAGVIAAVLWSNWPPTGFLEKRGPHIQTPGFEVTGHSASMEAQIKQKARQIAEVKTQTQEVRKRQPMPGHEQTVEQTIAEVESQIKGAEEQITEAKHRITEVKKYLQPSNQ
jgi:hypothetical protein